MIACIARYTGNSTDGRAGTASKFHRKYAGAKVIPEEYGQNIRVRVRVKMFRRNISPQPTLSDFIRSI